MFHTHKGNLIQRSLVDINNMEFRLQLLIHRNFPNGSGQWLFSNLFFVRTIITFHATFQHRGIEWERRHATVKFIKI